MRDRGTASEKRKEKRDALLRDLLAKKRVEQLRRSGYTCCLKVIRGRKKQQGREKDNPILGNVFSRSTASHGRLGLERS